MADKKSSMKAFAAALRAFADVVESEDAPATDTGAKPPPPPKRKPQEAAAGAAPTGSPAGTVSPADATNRASAAAAPGTPGAGDIMTQARQAAKSYAEVYGREGLKEVLSKYTQGTLADVASDRLPDLLKELS